MLQIKTTGVEDFIDGSANIAALIIGGPGAGKTRMSSYWPKPIFLDCENGRGSLADRNMPYVEVRSSKDMLDALEYLKGLEKIPKAQRQFQTVVVDTADSFSRTVKDEWVQKVQAQSFSGFDAWGYLDSKMQLLFTRLLNLDYNVIVLVHYKDKTYKDGDNTVRELTLQLQGAIADQVFNDFGLVGWLGTYWAAGEEGKIQKRGLTFQPTTDKPFLKDRFNVTPKWMEITFSDSDYQQIFEAFFNRPEFEALTAGEVVGEIPDADPAARRPTSAIAPPAEGGPLPPRPPAEAPEVPLEKKLKGELEDIAKGLGVQVRGNMLKHELVELIKKAQTTETGDVAGAQPPATPPSHSGDNARGFDAAQAIASINEAKAEVPTSPGSAPGNENSSSGSSKDDSNATNADAAAASSAASANTATSSASSQDEAQPLTFGQVAGALGAEVISLETADAPETPQTAAPSTPVAKPAAPKGPSACADCGRDLADEWADPSKRDYIRLSFVKHKRYLCSTCTAAANQ